MDTMISHDLQTRRLLATEQAGRHDAQRQLRTADFTTERCGHLDWLFDLYASTDGEMERQMILAAMKRVASS